MEWKEFECPIIYYDGGKNQTDNLCVVRLNGVPENYQVDEIKEMLIFEKKITPNSLLQLTVVRRGRTTTFDSGILRHRNNFFMHAEFRIVPNRPRVSLVVLYEHDSRVREAIENMLVKNKVPNRWYKIELDMPIIVLANHMRCNASEYFLQRYRNDNCLAIVYFQKNLWKIGFLGRAFESTISIEMEDFGIKTIFAVKDCLKPIGLSI